MSRTAATSTDSDLVKGGFRQAMSWLHTWAGLTLGWVLYFIFLTGAAGYFDTEIDRWMQPELPQAQVGVDTVATTTALLEQLKTEAPGAERWFLTLPAGRHQPYPGIFWQGAAVEEGASAVRGDRLVDAGGEILAPRDTGGGQLLYQMHWRLHYLSRIQADVLVGFATLFMLLALITGIIVHKKIFKDFFTFRLGKGQRSWLDAHNILSVVALPFHLMITYSGLIFMGFSYMPLIVAAHYGVDGDARQQFIADVFDPPGLVEEAAGEPASLVPLKGLVAEAESRWGEGRIRSIDIRHPGDANARIIFYENIERRVASSGERLVFDGASGELLHKVPPATSAAKNARDLFIGLHEGLFAPPLLRWLYFLSGLLGTAMIATGLVLWAVKRRQRVEKKQGVPHLGLRLVEKLNIGTIVGLPVGIAAYFWANRLLPVEMTGRAEWEVHILFLTWLVMLTHGVLRPTSRAWAEQLAIACAAFALLPVLNAFTTDRHLLHSLTTGDWVFAGFDLTMLVVGLLLGWSASQVNRKLPAENTGTPVPTTSSSRALYGEQS